MKSRPGGIDPACLLLQQPAGFALKSHYLWMLATIDPQAS
jgi:hypothetical protein